MIIAFKEEPETRLGFPCTAFRWSFQLDSDFIGIVHQHQINGDWNDSHTRVWAVYLMKDFLWGEEHFWYDGPHCLFSVGPIRFQWYNPSCKSCNGE
jgi:hypothetical protein